jgi:hypothetical protein
MEGKINKNHILIIDGISLYNLEFTKEVTGHNYTLYGYIRRI